VRRFQRSAYGLAKAIIGDPTKAEDIAQKALTRALHEAGTFDPHRDSASIWVLRITRDLAVEAFRRQGGEPLDQPAVIFLNHEGRRLPDQWAASDEKSHRVRAALRHIPTDERRALILATFYGYAARDIGEADGIPVSEARNRLHSGLSRLQQLLQEGEPAEPVSESCL
jgi:RNA polymerase sigma-70 factor (ECF subfamily)